MRVRMRRTEVAIAVRQLREHVERLGRRVDALDRAVMRMRTRDAEGNDKRDVLVIEEMSRDQVRDRILDVLAKKETTDIVELHETIRCDIRVLRDALDELRAEGRVFEG